MAAKNHQKSSLFSFWAGFFFPAPTIHQNLKIQTLDTKSFDFDVFWMPFGHPFSIDFPERLNLIICNTHNAKTSFLQFRAFHLASKINQQIMFFQTPFLDFIFLLFFSKTCRFGDPLQNPMGSKMAPKNDQATAKRRKSRSPPAPKRVPETSLRPSRSLKRPGSDFS